MFFTGIFSLLLTSASYRDHGVRVVRPFQTEAFNGRQSRDDNIGLVRSAGPVVSIEFKTCCACTCKKALWSWQTELCTHSHIVTTTIRCTCRF